MVDSTLLMTATFKPGNVPFLNLRNEKERIFQYLCAIISWVHTQKITNIVFCENSLTDYDFSGIKNYALEKGVRLETLIFRGSPLSEKFGKGYGEGEIIEYALENSEILKKTEFFMKVTGRLFVSNFNHFFDQIMESDNFFILQPVSAQTEDPSFGYWVRFWQARFRKGWVHTLRELKNLIHLTFLLKCLPYPLKFIDSRFFKTNTEFYKKLLIHRYKKIRDPIYDFESAFYDGIVQGGYVPELCSLQFTGMGGTHNVRYDDYYSKEIQEKALQYLNGGVHERS